MIKQFGKWLIEVDDIVSIELRPQNVFRIHLKNGQMIIMNKHSGGPEVEAAFKWRGNGKKDQ